MPVPDRHGTLKEQPRLLSVRRIDDDDRRALALDIPRRRTVVEVRNQQLTRFDRTAREAGRYEREAIGVQIAVGGAGRSLSRQKGTRRSSDTRHGPNYDSRQCHPEQMLKSRTRVCFFRGR